MASEPQNIQGGHVRPKLEPQPTAFFDILAENDIQVRERKIESLSCKDYSRSASGMKLTELLESLAGDQYIAKDRIRLLRKLGEGGFAVVEKAELDHGANKEPEIVAIKTLKPGLIEDDQDLQELIQEANVLRKLKHRYIVEFRGIGCLKKGSVSEMRSSVFFAEEYMAGGSLKGALVRQMKGKSGQIYRAEDAWRWCLQVAEALDYLHHCKPAVVHRDLKPENVLLTCSTMAKAEAHIADFGLHKRINRVRKARNASYRSLNAACQPDVETGEGASALFHDVSGNKEASSSDLLIHDGAENESPGGVGGVRSGGKKKKVVTWKDLEETGEAEEAPQETDSTVPSRKVAPLAISTVHSSTGDGGHGDDGTNVPASPFMRGSRSLGDASLSPDVDRQPLVTSGHERSDELTEYPSNASAGGTSSSEIHPVSANEGGLGGSKQEERQSRKGGLSRAVDSFKVANNRRGRHKNYGYPLEGQQRGSSNALDRLVDDEDKHDKVSLVPDAYSSVIYSLGLSGTGDLSGMVGSLMYMAPEVVKGTKYTEKIDVFAFGLIMYELFIGRLTIVKVLAAAFSPKQMELELQRHARRVAKGHRETIPHEWPEALADLIRDCWHENPDRRPRMGDVITRLYDLEKMGVVHEMEDLFIKQLKSRGGQWRCCAIA